MKRIAELADEIGHLDGALDERAGRLTALRTAAASAQGLVEAELAALAMPKACYGFDIAPFRARTVGRRPRPAAVRRQPRINAGAARLVASGGGLSRVRLALEVVLAADSTGRTFVFDEVDAGVEAARLRSRSDAASRVSRSTLKVIVVTHLAQVAAFAGAYVVEKADDGQVTTAGVREVTVTERVDELARMMAGLDGTDAARRHAEELLQAARRASRRPSR